MLPNTNRPASGDDDVIDDVDAQGFAGVLQTLGQGEIVAARCGVAGRVIVDQQDRLGGILDGGSEHLARVNQAAVQTADADAMGADHPEYTATLENVPESTRKSLLADLA